MTNRNGFTLVEIFVVLVILGILSGVGLFKYIDFREQAYASKVAADMNSTKIAAFSAWADAEQWPPEAGPGIEPIEIRRHLPGNVTFANADYTLDWDNLISGKIFAGQKACPFSHIPIYQTCDFTLVEAFPGIPGNLLKKSCTIRISLHITRLVIAAARLVELPAVWSHGQDGIEQSEELSLLFIYKMLFG